MQRKTAEDSFFLCEAVDLPISITLMFYWLPFTFFVRAFTANSSSLKAEPKTGNFTSAAPAMFHVMQQPNELDQGVILHTEDKTCALHLPVVFITSLSHVPVKQAKPHCLETDENSTK